MSRRLIAIAIFAGIMLATPKSTEASIIDLIWELSGPQLIGVGVTCRWDFNRNVDVCDFAAPTRGVRADRGLRSRLLFSTTATAFVSTSKKSSSNVDYKWGDVYMIAAEPGLAFNSVGGESGVHVYHGVGASYNLFFGRIFKTFDKVSIKVTPVEVVFPDKRVSLAATIRLYPNGFSNDEFGIGPRLDYDRPFEAVYGVTFGFLFKSR